MCQPKHWTADELEVLRKESRAQFRTGRLAEPVNQYVAEFDKYSAKVKGMLRSTQDLASLAGQIEAVLRNPEEREILRALTGPPISKDDMDTLAEVDLETSRALRDKEALDRVYQVIQRSLDTRRFPWVAANRAPTQSEALAAVVATAALIAVRRTETTRRHLVKDCQEGDVRNCLEAIGFRAVPSRKIENITQAPQVEEFCGESVLAGRKADLVVRLYDGRILALECKVSNSEINSVKRLNNDAAVKAVHWTKEFGTRNVVPAAVISGVYKLSNLVRAQNDGLFLFWGHRLLDLQEFIQSTQ